MKAPDCYSDLVENSIPIIFASLKNLGYTLRL